MSKFFNHNWLDTLANTKVHLSDNRIAEVETKRPNHLFIGGGTYVDKWTISVHISDSPYGVSQTYGYADDLYDAWDMHNEVVDHLINNRFNTGFIGDLQQPIY